VEENTDYRLAPEVKAAWLEALRSGKYVQGTGRLHKGDKYCCLGVLCDVMGAREQFPSPPAIGTHPSYFAYKGTVSCDVLPHALAKELGITVGGTLNRPIENGDLPPFKSLWELNDCAGYNFAQIAQVIEEQF